MIQTYILMYIFIQQQALSRPLSSPSAPSDIFALVFAALSLLSVIRLCSISASDFGKSVWGWFSVLCLISSSILDLSTAYSSWITGQTGAQTYNFLALASLKALLLLLRPANNRRFVKNVFYHLLSQPVWGISRGLPFLGIIPLLIKGYTRTLSIVDLSAIGKGLDSTVPAASIHGTFTQCMQTCLSTCVPCLPRYLT